MDQVLCPTVSTVKVLTIANLQHAEVHTSTNLEHAKVHTIAILQHVPRYIPWQSTNTFRGSHHRRPLTHLGSHHRKPPKRHKVQIIANLQHAEVHTIANPRHTADLNFRTI